MFTNLLAATLSLDKTVQPIIQLCSTLTPILLAVVGAVGAIWCILLGVKYAKAEDPQEHEKAKKALVNSIIGYILIFILLLMLKFGTSALSDWYKDAIAAGSV